MTDKQYRWRMEGKKAVQAEIRILSKDRMDYGSPGFEFVDFQSTLNTAATREELLELQISKARKQIEEHRKAITELLHDIEIYQVQL